MELHRAFANIWKNVEKYFPYSLVKRYWIMSNGLCLIKDIRQLCHLAILDLTTCNTW